LTRIVEPAKRQERRMRIVVFSSKPYDRTFLDAANRQYGYDMLFVEPRLTAETVGMAARFDAVCVFVNDRLDDAVLEQLARGGTRIVALRCAGFNNVDIPAAERLGLDVVRVPAYSPYSVAEHAAGLILTLNRKFHRAYSRVREGNFSLAGLLGFDLHGRTVGIIGTGQIGTVFARIMAGFGCRLLGHDPHPNAECESLGMASVPLNDLLAQSDIISLHCPLTPATHHLINADALQQMKTGVMLINTSRGAIVDTRAVIGGLKSGKIGYLGLDVYEEEADYFFENLSEKVIADDVLARLLTFPNVVVTGHQAFFTQDALQSIAETTLRNIGDVEKTGRSENQVTAVRIPGSPGT
jgi:D-lactate dehydrogenase